MTLTGKRVAVLDRAAVSGNGGVVSGVPAARGRVRGRAGRHRRRARPIASKLGYPAIANLAAKDASADTFHAVVIPGGFAPDYIRRREPMLKLVRDLFAQRQAGRGDLPRSVGALFCPTTARRTVLKGKKVTCFHSIKDDVANAGGTYVDQEVVVDGNVITSRKPDDLPAFVVAMMEQMRKG